MAYSPIEDKYLSTLTAQQFPDMPPEPVAAEPSVDGVQLAMGGSGAGKGRTNAPISDAGMGLLDMGAATVKGAAQGFVGLPGDLEGIGRLLLDKMGYGVSQNTVLPKTDEVKKWLDKNVGQVGTGQNPYESIGEVAAPGGQVKAVKAVGRGAKALAPKAGEMIINATEKTGVPVRGLSIIENSLTTKGAKLTPDLEVPAAGDITKPAFKKWFGDSKVTDDKGQPLVMYHGTAQDIHQFRAKQAGAIFVTDDPSFADNFSDMSQSWMVEHYKEILSKEQVATANNQAEEAIRKHFADDQEKADLLVHRMRTGELLHPVVRSEFNKAISDQMPTGPNTVPVYVSAKRPFDYENKEHIAAVVAELNKSTNSWGTPRGTSAKPFIESGNWEEIEKASTQEAIKAAGFDGFYVKEGKKKNLAVYDPSQIKSVFNKGTWNPNDPRILHGAGAGTAGTAATMQDKEKN